MPINKGKKRRIPAKRRTRAVASRRSARSRRKKIQKQLRSGVVRMRTPYGVLDTYLTLPAHKKLADCPVVVFLPGRTDDHQQHWYPELYRALARKGIASLGVSMNGHGKSYGAFEQFTYRRGLADAKSVIAWLRAKKVRRIGISGFSQGGGVAILAAAEDPGILAAGLIAPVALPQFVHESLLTHAERAFLQTHAYVLTKDATRRVNKTFFLENARHPSFLPDAQQIHSPTYIAHGTRDTAVPLFHSKRLYTAIACDGNLKSLQTLLGADHVFSKKEHQHQLIRGLVQFFAVHVGRDEITTVLGAVMHHGSLLLLQRSTRVYSHHLEWDVIGGSIHPGEDPDRKVLEEIEEESGIPRIFLHIQKRKIHREFVPQYGITVRAYVYHVTAEINRVKLNWENVAFRWVRPTQLPAGKLRSRVRRILVLLGII